MDRLTEMTSFVAVADRGSFAAAAAELGVSAQIVGRRIGQMEERLGMPLFVRNTRTSRLTEAGRLFYGQCRTIIDAVSAAERSVADLATGPSRGTLTISAPRAFGGMVLAPIIAGYLEQHSAMAVRLVLSDRFVDLVAEQVDLAVRIGTLPDSGLIARRLRDYTLSPFASPNYLAKRGAPSDPADLAAHECIIFVYEAGGTLNEWEFTDGSTTQRVRVNGRLFTEDGRAMMEAAAAGYGIVLQDEALLASFIQDGRLVRVLPAFYGPSRRMSVVYPPASATSPTLRSLVSYLLQHLA